MATRTYHNLSIVEAVETLSSISDLEFDHEIGITQRHELILSDEKIAYKTVHWLHREEAGSTINYVRETFRVLLHYLKEFYKKEYDNVTDPQTLDEIKMVMVLVMEAAKKLDKYTHLFHQPQSVRDFKEYKLLQEFCRSKIALKKEGGALSKWVLSLSVGKIDKNIEFRAPAGLSDGKLESKHIFVDLEAVKKDTVYDLFFVRKEDGSQFFSPRLLRNMKLVCDFSRYFGERKELDPLEHINQWYDRCAHSYAKEIIRALGSRLNYFFIEARKTKSHELIERLNKALLALMLSSHSSNLLHHHPIKCCTEYFDDFQRFLREAIQTKFFQKWSIQLEENNRLGSILVDIIQVVCRSLYTGLQGLEEMKPVIQGLIQEGSLKKNSEIEKNKESICARLLEDNVHLSKLLKHHPNGPLFKIIKSLEEKRFNVFDSILQHNLPNQLFYLYNDEKKIGFLRIPAPIYQEFINKAIVNDEFVNFIRYNNTRTVPHKHLLINLQDRTSWREYARSFALEEFQKNPETKNFLLVVTLATHTDFYHQLPPYHQSNHAHLFKEQFKELLIDEHAGYFFSSAINPIELSFFIDHAFEVIHRAFFGSKNVLLRENRLDFIELFYLFLQLKLIDWIQPDTVSLTCKDGIDIGEVFSVEIFVFLKLLNNAVWSDADWSHVNYMLYAPALLIRERLLLPDRFNRMLSALKTVENVRAQAGAANFTQLMNSELKVLYETPIHQFNLYLPAK